MYETIYKNANKRAAAQIFKTTCPHCGARINILGETGSKGHTCHNCGKKYVTYAEAGRMCIRRA